MTMEYDQLPALPKSSDSIHRARQIFNAHAQWILDGWELRKQMKAARRAESHFAWFKREAYQLLEHYTFLGLTDVFRRNVRLDRRSSSLIEESLKNPFKLGLLAMFADESPLGSKNRHVFGNQMFYAWLHDVPPEFLNAFLAVAGGPELISSKLKARIAEPGFEKRFKPERLLAQ